MIEITKNFIHDIIDADLEADRCGNVIRTRFPPEPNGYLHIGHAKSICLNFSTAMKYGGYCHMRFDDTNPAKEEDEFIESILADVSWLGFSWGDNLFFASSYFEQLYGYAVELIKKGLAYVCDLTADEMRAYRGTLTVAGTPSPYRERSVEENLRLFADMRAGKFPDGHCTLRAKIDMASPNFNMRDPAIYRIQRSHHPRTGNDWCIYPMYDFAHPLSDAIEGITHSVCTLEFENHRPLYAWVLDNTSIECVCKQYEFARLNITNTVMSKRKLRRLVEEGFVNGWDDPRMPTISGLRRRGYTPESIRDFCDRIGVARANSMVEYSLLEHCIRDDINAKVDRVMTVLDPIKLVITNYEAGASEELFIPKHPDFPERGDRKANFGRELYIEREDFMIDPPKKYFRLKPEGEVRLKGAYIITCHDYITNEAGEVVEIHCTYDPETKSGTGCTKKVKGTIHWVNATTAEKITVNLYDNLFLQANPDDVEEGVDFTDTINPDSFSATTAYLEEAYADLAIGDRVQFLRHGYFIKDKDSTEAGAVFNRIVSLKDSWSKIKNK